jgi:TadE-like protein
VIRAGRRRSGGRRGQALVETAVVIAVLLGMLTGVYAVSQFASDQNTAGTATRAGARLAAELGNNNYTGGVTAACQGVDPTNPCGVDRQIVQVVCQIALTMPFVSSVDEVDIYLPTQSNGQRLGTDLVERYQSCTAGTAPLGATASWYTLDKRNQTHPVETFIGVSVTYHYKSPTPVFPLNAVPTVYTVIQMSPRFS